MKFCPVEQKLCAESAVKNCEPVYCKINLVHFGDIKECPKKKDDGGYHAKRTMDKR